ncbi:MAG: nitrous oxide-stimulated promoter family protein [Lentisphaerae bacterium]|nr:nitrous oxide-stimulated promoter family protein [Lentisphaerota bacterium]
MEQNSARHGGDIKTLHAMLGIYCRDKHESAGTLCSECRELLAYATARLAKCPFGEKKPTCARCTIHCYQPAMRARVKTVMKHSGPRMLTTHPILAARHILHGLTHKPSRKASPS